VVILLEAEMGGLAELRPGPWLRLKARLAADRLDGELTSGASPDSSPLLAIHAQRIVDPTACSALAGSVRRVVERARLVDRARVVERGPRRLAASARVPVSATAVAAAAGDLCALADRLDEPGPLRARGVAEVRALLRDGAGPLYLSREVAIPGGGDRGCRSLRAQIDAALQHI
jgi:hypothetical protein